MKYKLKLSGLDCAHCTQKIEDRINQENDIQDCMISFANGLMTFESDNEQILEKVIDIIHQIEPDVKIQNMMTQITDEKKYSQCYHEHHHEHDHCNCNHDHHEHDHCDCEHEHHHEHDHCDCEHEHHHKHDHCDCGHEHHHEHEHCNCDHDHHEHDHCDCGHAHEAIPERDIKDGVRFSIQGLDCANCAMKVENEIKKQPYVVDAVINFSTGKLIVKTNNHDDLLNNLQKVIDSVEEGVTLTSDESIKYKKPRLFVLKDNIELLEGVIVFIAALLTKGWFSTFLYISAYLLIGYKVILKALKNIGRKDFLDENFLMCIATFGAIALHDYSEAIAVMLFYAIGEIFQGYAVNKTRHSISSLMDIKSEYANLVINDEIKKVKPENVQINDVIVVKVGEKIPLDGQIIEGQSMLDTSSLTGESLPRNVQVGDEVLSGVVNLSEIIYVKVTKPYQDSTVSKIIDLVENSASKKAQIEKFITRFARVYTPAVVGLAILLLFVPMIILPNQSFQTWLYRACTFLVVSCPCALVISIPLGLYAGLGKASSLGVLIKGGNYLELLKDVDTVVFDKTGTLTKGEFEVIDISDRSLLEIGAYGEYMSNHPIAKSIVSSYDKEIDNSRITNFKESAGQGISVEIDHELYHLGNERYFTQLGIAVQHPQTVGTIVYIAKDHTYLGYIVVGDVIKETAVAGIQALKDEHIKNTVMLTGDHHDVAHDIAQKIGIDTVYSDLLPQDKVTQLEKLLNKDSIVTFVGDGINDAPVLARADLGIAMGGVGSDVAIEAADVVLMTDDIMTISKAIHVSRLTNTILKENVTFTLLIKIGVLILTLFGLTNMWMGVFADVGVTLIAILNSMRILYKK